MNRHLLILLWLVFVLLAGNQLEAVVISEIHYNPGEGLEALEFVELASDTTTPEDISGYRFSGGITYQFPPGTILTRYQKIIVCADRQAVIKRYGIDAGLVFGNFIGRMNFFLFGRPSAVLCIQI